MTSQSDLRGWERVVLAILISLLAITAVFGILSVVRIFVEFPGIWFRILALVAVPGCVFLIWDSVVTLRANAFYLTNALRDPLVRAVFDKDETGKLARTILFEVGSLFGISVLLFSVVGIWLPGVGSIGTTLALLAIAVFLWVDWFRHR